MDTICANSSEFITPRRVLISSNYRAWPEVYNGQSYGFLNVISQIEACDSVQPEPASYSIGRGLRPNAPFLIGELRHRVASQTRRALGRPRTSNCAVTEIEQDYDVFMFMCQFPLELGALERLKGWRKHSKIAVAYVLETWSYALHETRHELALLNEFDHVFVLNAQSIETLSRYVTAPISFLPSATDCLLATPPIPSVERVIDVFSFGRRAAPIHRHLLGLAKADPEFFYMFDTAKGGEITDFAEHRLQTANLLKRSRYTIGYNPRDLGVYHREGAPREDALSTRYFEAAAGGAITLGSAPFCDEFNDLFDWPDAVINLPTSTKNLKGFLDELEQEPERLLAARCNNIYQSLRRHDWSHRWRDILTTLGLLPTSQHAERIAELDRLADLFLKSEQPHQVAQLDS